MILTFLINSFQSLFDAVFSVIPALPPISQSVISGGNWIVSTVASVIFPFQYLYTPVLFNFMFVGLLGIVLFEPTYHLILWILRKIPVFGIK